MLKTNETSFNIGKHNIELSTGKLANFANGSCVIKCNDTVIFSSVCSSSESLDNVDFLPLQVEYRENYSASGIIPGGYIKREGKPSDREILISRIIDRSIRPLFSKSYHNEVQVCVNLLSSDKINDTDFLGIISVSTALMLSDLPFDGPIGAVKVGLIDGNFIANPTFEEMKKSKLDLVYSGKVDKVIMIEGDASEISELDLKKALEFANEHIKIQIEAQLKLIDECGKNKIKIDNNNSDKGLECKLYNYSKEYDNFCKDLNIEDACFIADKTKRSYELKLIFDKIKNHFINNLNYDDSNELISQLKYLYEENIKKLVRTSIIKNKKRIDGRKLDQIRDIDMEIGILPDRVHGSSLFSRGNTQSLAMVTLGSARDAQEINSIVGFNKTDKKNFYLHYNFPGYSVGEVKRSSGPGRREIGHGNLAERSLLKVIPINYDYVIRCVSEIMTSNGSTSMASVCSGSLALMDAGVPIKKHVAGISCGLVKEKDPEEEKDLEELLLDITGTEDHYGDMDFKIAGTIDGITGFQLDLKIAGISIDLLYKAMIYNKSGREKILSMMNEYISKPNLETSEFAPKSKFIKISVDKIGTLIGPGGKNIKSIIEETGANIDIDNDGTIKIFADNIEAINNVTKRINKYIPNISLGQTYDGIIKSIIKSGVFVEFLPGHDGFVHVSALTGNYIKNISSLYKIGDKVSVKVIEVDGNRVKLSCIDVDQKNKD